MPKLELFLLAISFYTRLPTPHWLDFNKLPQATVFLPLIGWLVGSITALGFYLAHLLWSDTTAVILALVIGIFTTGSFHEDGFADVCDGFGGAYDKQGILEIMKDSQIGVYGTIGLLMLFALKISLLVSMSDTFVPLILIAAHSVSRLPPVFLMNHYDYARKNNSKSREAVYQPNRRELSFATVIALLPMLLLPGLCWLAIIPTFIANSLLGSYFFRHIGGYTGDCLGASQQISETIFYLSVSALWIYI